MKEGIPAIVLMSHGPLSQALLESAELIVGKIENVAYMCLEAGDNPAEFKEELKKLLDSLPEKKLVLVDLLGGTPCNSFMGVFNQIKFKTNAIAGMNLPMLLEAVNCRRNMAGVELSDCIEESGKESICNIVERVFGTKY